MIKSIYSVYDEKTLAWLNPFNLVNDGEAIRGFSDAVNDPSSMFNKHPNDFHLYKLGTFDDSKGQIHQDGINKHVISAMEVYIRTPEQENQLDLKLNIEELTQAVLALTSADIAN
nr:MAG: nonstructural protein [Microvirus sp.]